MAMTRKNRLPKNATTLHQINHWHRHVFTHLGWMVLAKAKGMTGKVKVYKESVNNLCESIRQLMREYDSHNSKHDLKVILMQVEVLQRQMNKIL